MAETSTATNRNRPKNLKSESKLSSYEKVAKKTSAKKKPFHKSRLVDRSQAPDPSSSTQPVIKNKNVREQKIETVSLPTTATTDMSKKYYEVKEIIKETGEKFSLLHLNEDSVIETMAKTSTSKSFNRRPILKPESELPSNEEFTPKIIIKRRPLRRPRLPDGSLVPDPGPSTQSVFQNSNMCQQKSKTVPLPIMNKTKRHNQEPYLSRVNHLKQTTRETEKKLNKKSLRLSQDSLIESTASTLSTPEKSVSNGIEKTKTRKKTKKKKDPVDNENLKNDNNTNPELNITVVDVNSTKEVKPTKCRFLLKCIEKKKLKKSQKNTPVESESKENSDESNNSAKALKKKKKNMKKVFCEHLPVDVVKKLLAVQNPEKPSIVEGCIRINPRCYQNAYISLTNGDQDILIVGLKDRNRAFEGDLVAVIINHPNRWFKTGEGSYQKTGSVVSILEKVHPRKAVGHLKKQDVFVFLQPRDSRVPITKINPRTVPTNFYDNPDLFKETLFLCNIVDWKKVAFAEGEIQQIIGNKGDLSVETNAILLENNLILKPYEEDLLKDLPPADYIPIEEDLKDRDDLRKTCIFTIDPATAVDLDDAMSCKPLENGNFEVGVHISDVTHFLKAFSPLDRNVEERATTVYMVDNVYHMLPKQLCMACSLLPGQDKLAFSVILELTPDGNIVNYRFCKSVINSCCQMSYDQAQIMIDDDAYDWQKDGSLKIYGNYEPADLAKVVRNLYQLSTQLRKKRFDGGALKIDQPKLCVFLDRETGLPVSYKLEEKRESNSLIEEFMLLANMTVAKHLYENLPEVSLLRSHAEPSKQILNKTRDMLLKFGVILDVESAGSLHNSLLMHQMGSSAVDSETDVAHYRMMVINSLCARSMTRAVYKCSSAVESKNSLKHYALNVEFYTHFTSPIRRYPDCVVHRLLYATIKNQPLPDEWSSEICRKIASNCNVKKYSAKMAQEQSNTLYFTYMLDLRGSMNVLAIVMDVKERSVDAMLCDTGLKVRLYFADTIEETTVEYTMEHDVQTVKLTWVERGIEQVINIFSILHVKITKHTQLFRLHGIILPPFQAD